MRPECSAGPLSVSSVLLHEAGRFGFFLFFVDTHVHTVASVEERCLVGRGLEKLQGAIECLVAQRERVVVACRDLFGTVDMAVVPSFEARQELCWHVQLKLLLWENIRV